MPSKTHKESWEDRFGEAFPRDLREVYRQGDGSWSAGVIKMSGVIKSFIRSELSQQAEEMDKNIGQLRQWLNEERITDPQKMVTNEELKIWLTN